MIMFFIIFCKRNAGIMGGWKDGLSNKQQA